MPNHPASRPITCPVCGLSDQVEKVSTIYMSGIADKRSPEIKQATKIPPQKLVSLSRMMAPPSSGKSVPIRTLHPDMVLIVFSCVLPFFLLGILKQQPIMLVPVLLVLAALYGLYFFKRKAIIVKFERDQNNQRESQARIERGIQTWMKLYYCARDEGIFLPGKDELVPPEQMISYLMRGSRTG
jgi:hypothetical protein